MSHLTIIGSGIAAIAAAIEGTAQGTKVEIVRGRPGATALSSGAWDIASPPDRHPGLRWQEYPSPAENLRQIVRRFGRHPYSLMAQNDRCGDLASFLGQAIERVSAKLDLRLRGSTGKNLFVLNPLGGLKPTAFAAQSHWAGNLPEIRGERLLIVGFHGLPTFHADQAADLLKEIVSGRKTLFWEEIRSTTLSLEGLSPLPGPISLAGQFDREETIDSLHRHLVREAEQHRATHIALPPVIGIERTDHILSRLREATGLTWFETLGVPPSLPGLRLQRAIEGLLERSETREGEAIGAITKNRRIVALRVRKENGEEELPVERLILATGRFIGGGIVKEKSFREPVLNLPLSSPPDIFVERLTSNRFLDNHPLFSVGVRVNRNMQPLGERGELLYDNLWVAGSLIGGYNPAIQHCGMGVAVGTGTLAGRLASL